MRVAETREEREDRKQFCIDALAAENWTDLRAMGWMDVWNALLHRFQRYGRQDRIGEVEARAWLDVLGEYRAEVVLGAVDVWARGETSPPKPADLLPLITGRNNRSGPAEERRTRRDNSPAVLALVAAALKAGGETCECRPAPLTFVEDERGFLWCAGCAKHEVGQADSALELDDDVLEEFVPEAPLIRFRRLRGERAA